MHAGSTGSRAVRLFPVSFGEKDMQQQAAATACDTRIKAKQQWWWLLVVVVVGNNSRGAGQVG